MIEAITPLIITFDEAPNIARTLAALSWAHRIVVVDSGSTDGTVEIVARYAQAELFSRPFDTAANQCNFGLSLILSEWTLSLDADYELSDELIEELQGMSDDAGIAGYRAAFVYRIYGRSLAGTLYPPRTVLYRTRSARYRDEGHTQRVVVTGDVKGLCNPIFHDDRKSLSRWLQSQQRYARMEAEHLISTPSKDLSKSARVRLAAVPAPFLVFVYTLLIKRCLFDGWSGWLYALQRLLAETMLALELVNRRLAAQARPKDQA